MWNYKLSTSQSIFAVVAFSIGAAGITALASNPSSKQTIAFKDSSRTHKADLERIRVIPITRVPMTRVASLDPPAEQHAAPKPNDAVAVEEPVPSPVAPVRRHWHIGENTHDICTAHGLHKVFTQNGKSWRCR